MAHWKVEYKDLEFGEKLGEGNFGAVYKGDYIGTKVAIKKLYYVDDEFMQKYIEREMDTLTAIHHPNIVQLIGICIESDDVYIITEFIHGGDLHKRLLDPTLILGWPEKVSFMKDVCLAMTYLHSKGIMHRDLKSHNLLIGEGGKVKVCDFGLARSEGNVEEGKSHQKTIVGTHEWMSPEIAMGQNYDKSADVFSFAMVMYEILTRGEPPPRKLVEGFQFKPDHHKPNIPADTPPELWKILVDCAQTVSKDRPAFKDAIRRLTALGETMPAPKIDALAAGSAPPPPEVKKKKKKKKTTDGEKKKKKSTDASSAPTDVEKKKKRKKKTTDGEKKKDVGGGGGGAGDVEANKKKKSSGEGEKEKKKKKPTENEKEKVLSSPDAKKASSPDTKKK